MGKLNRLHQIIGWLVFTIAALVYIFSAERTGSLWDVGEFILGAHKLQVVHPPGAPLFLLIGRLFAGVGDIIGGDNQSMIAYFVNMLSGFCTAFGAAFVAWSTMRLSKVSIFGAKNYAPQIGSGQNVAIAASGLVAGLGTAFSSSIWFSAVEGEVYAMSLFFTCMTLWAVIKWYVQPDNPATDRWLLFALFSAGLSTGVHLLSILTIPAMAIFYYYKRYEQTNFWGLVLSVVAGVGIIVFIQAFIIVGIPTMWLAFEIPMVNGMGLPVHSGIIPTMAMVIASICLGLHVSRELAVTGAVSNGKKFGLAALLAVISLMTMGVLGFFVAVLLVIGVMVLSKPKHAFALQQLFVGFGLLMIAYSTVGVVVIRAGAKTPVNMNNPDNVTSLLPYLNREQYGERSLLNGQTFRAQARFGGSEERYGLVDGEYVEGLTEKVNIDYTEKMLFSRMYDNTQGRIGLYRQWMGVPPSTNPEDPLAGLPSNRPNMGDNVKFFLRYQVGWMYWRYFMWNFSGRQNGEQGYYDWDESSGNWITGIKVLDEARLGNLDEVPEWEENDPAHNKYYLLPFLFGLIGLLWHAKQSGKEFIGLLALFVITGLGIIIYTNQPPNEPRERDYVLVGSFFTFCMWMGMAVPALYETLKKSVNVKGFAPAVGIGAVVLIAPLLMGFQNWDDHSRANHTGARDYASNFLNSVDENAVIFTYGDNDTYPLWYAQEVEGIRPDVRVVNLSLIAVDWYINLLRYKMNDSAPLKLTLSEGMIAGNRRNRVPYIPNAGNPDRDCAKDRPITLDKLMNDIAKDNPDQRVPNTETQYQSCNVGINVDPGKLRNAPWLTPDGEQARARIPIRVNNYQLLKDEIAILDIINNNFYERPIYWAVTCRQEKLMGLEPFLQLEGLGLKLTATANQSELRQYGIIGSGGINAEKTADLILDTWRYGNFDKEDTHINTSYAPAVQSMQIVTQRTMNTLVDQGKIEEALAVGDKYFASFPNFNFPFKYQTLQMLQPYLTTRNGSRARAVIEQLARNTVEQLDFFTSVDPNIVANSPTYRREKDLSERIVATLVTQVRQQEDPELTASVEGILQPYLFLVPEPQAPRQ